MQNEEKGARAQRISRTAEGHWFSGASHVLARSLNPPLQEGPRILAALVQRPEASETLAFCRERDSAPPERRDIGRALQPEEKLRLLKVAQSRPEWETAYLASMLALNTTMRACEIKQLRWRDIDLIDHSLVIRRSKTQAGERLIPLNANSYQMIMRLRERARILFGNDLQPDWYLFPGLRGIRSPIQQSQ